MPTNLAVCPPITPNELLGVRFIDQYRLPFGKRNLYFYQAFWGESVDIIGVSEGRIGGRILNQLLHMIKPEKATYGIDTGDILNDWKLIDTPANAERLHIHEQMPGFKAFMGEKDMYWDLIQKAYGGWSSSGAVWKRENPSKGLKGVIWWKVNYEGKRQIVFDRLGERLQPPYDYILEKHSRGFKDRPFISSIVGMFLLAYFSPEIRADEVLWPSRDTYGGECTNTNNMGTTQVGTMALRYADRFLKSPFIAAAERYVAETAVGLC